MVHKRVKKWHQKIGFKVHSCLPNNTLCVARALYYIKVLPDYWSFASEFWRGKNVWGIITRLSSIGLHQENVKDSSSYWRFQVPYKRIWDHYFNKNKTEKGSKWVKCNRNKLYSITQPRRYRKSLYGVKYKRNNLYSITQPRNLNVKTRYNVLNFPALFSALAVEQ